MSTDLYWRPATPQPPGHQLPPALKSILARRLWGDDGSLTSDGEVEMNKADRMYLEGLGDAGVDGAAELIQAIREHGVVAVWIE